MKTLYVVPIEPIETRYTKHWYTYAYELIKKNIPDINVKQLEVDWQPVQNSDGAFLNFAATSVYKSDQMTLISDMFMTNEIEPGDGFLFMDYWNPTANMVRYMSHLNGIPVKIMGICHAGYWDNYDILHQKFEGDYYEPGYHREWIKKLEDSLDYLYDAKFFATEFGKGLYEESYNKNTNKNFVTGFPMEYYDEVMTPYWELKNPPKKENIVCFPHRKSPEKGLDIFWEIAKEHDDYDFVISMDVCNTKEEYHDLLYRSKFCFSDSMQETLGISMGIEALRAGCDCIVPDRLSYNEMFLPHFKCSNYDDVDQRLNNGPNSLDIIKHQHDLNYNRYFNGAKMYYHIQKIMNCV